VYKNFAEFFNTEEKAVFGLTWPQLMLVLAGVVLGSLVSQAVKASPAVNLGLIVGCALVCLGIAVIRIRHVPTYQVLGAILHYWSRRVQRGPTVLHSADLWPTQAQAEWESLLIEGTQGPLVQVEQDRDLFRPR